MASEQRSQTILESITDGFFVLDQEWRFVYVNPEAERILECRPGALLDRVLWEAYPGTVGSVFEQTYRRVTANQRAESFQAFYPDHGRWYDLRAFPLPTGISVYFRDVTEAKESGAALRASEERRRLALEAAELGAWNIDFTGPTLEADERFSEIFTGSARRMDYAQASTVLCTGRRPRDARSDRASTRAETLPYAIEISTSGLHPDARCVGWVACSLRARASRHSTCDAPRPGQLGWHCRRRSPPADEPEEDFADSQPKVVRWRTSARRILADVATSSRNPLARFAWACS
jgi:PAS domain S-box-containing protein